MTKSYSVANWGIIRDRETSECIQGYIHVRGIY